jgi:CheY-like chemotaxis protein
MRILIVDDDIFVRRIITEKLSIARFTNITEASSGNEAIKILESNYQFDLVISDYCMADGDGADLLNHIYKTNLSVLFLFFTSALEIEIPFSNSQFLGVIEKMNINKLVELMTSLPNEPEQTIRACIS